MSILKSELMRTYDMRPSTAEQIMEIAEHIDRIAKIEYARGYADGNAELRHPWTLCNEETGDGYPEEEGFYYVTEQNYGYLLDAPTKERCSHTSHFTDGKFTDRFYEKTHSNIIAWCKVPGTYNGD